MAESPASNKIRVPVVTKEGPVYGFISETDVGHFYRFSGIPYAKPPLGNLRFLPPSPIQNWTEPIDCTKEPPQCYTPTDVDKFTGSEDCLYISLSTPNMTPKKPLPVMFWIGSFSYSYSIDSVLDPSLLLQQDVLFVHCGFRLGPFGFLCINDVTAPGNAGLKDIVMALKWVQRNISLFGGDPNNVTLFGTSCGGSIVHCMMLSQMTAGLFHKAIVQSSSALNNWSLVKNPYQPVFDLAKELGLDTQCKYAIVDMLKKMPAEEIFAAFGRMTMRIFKSDTDYFGAVFKPCIEEEFEGQPAFWTKSPFMIIKSGKFNKVPLIIGSNNTETVISSNMKNNFYENYKISNKNPRLIVPKPLAGELNVSNNIGQQLIKFYIGEDETIGPDTKDQYAQLVSDYYFLFYINKSVRMHSQYSSECPVYYYILNYAGNWNIPEDMNYFSSMGHCGELPCIFRIKPSGLPACRVGREAAQVRERVVKLWTNFAKYGNPTPDDNDPLLQITWDAVENEDRLNYLSIGSELTKGRNPFYDRMKFWDQLYHEHIFLRTLIYFSDRGFSW